MYIVVNHSPKYQRRRRIAAGLGIALGGILLGIVGVLATPVPVGTPQVNACEEDQSCWDCTTMGNGVCGPVTVTEVNGTDVLIDGQGNILGPISQP